MSAELGTVQPKESLFSGCRILRSRITNERPAKTYKSVSAHKIMSPAAATHPSRCHRNGYFPLQEGSKSTSVGDIVVKGILDGCSWGIRLICIGLTLAIVEEGGEVPIWENGAWNDE